MGFVRRGLLGPRGLTTGALVGEQLAGYRIEAVAGRGGMGVVYRARQVALDRTVALKVITPELAGDARFRARFLRESRVAASLDHPNVIPVFEAGEDAGRAFIAMRFVEGTDLARTIRARGPLEPRLAARILRQAAAALDSAHARGLVHRDVKPANLLLAGDPDDPHVYLTDFGLAKDESVSSLTGSDGWLGTPDFAAPEQVEGKPVDARTDVYALGCVAFAALTGSPPFVRESALAKAWAHVNDQPPPLPRSAPPHMRAAIARALSKRPGERFETAGAFAEALGERRSLPRAATRPTARLIRSAPRWRRAWLVIAAVGVLAAASATLLATTGATRAHHAIRRPMAREPLPPPATRAADPAAGTVRCTGATCRQAGALVLAPIEGAPCGAGRWTRLDAGAPEPLLGCEPAHPLAAAPVRVPDLAGARLDLAGGLLDKLSIRHDTSGGGLFGVIVESNWKVCATAPPPGAPLPSGLKLKLFVDRSC